MFKKIIITIQLAFTAIAANAQAPWPYVVPNTDWFQFFSSRGNVANGPTAIDANNNMFLTGYTGSSPSACNILTQKRDSTGALVFTAIYNNGNYDRGNAIKVHGTNVHVAGVSYDNATKNDYVVIQYSGTGSQLWAYRYDLAGQDDEATDIKVDAAGNSYVTGTARNSNGDLDIVTFKLNSSGVLQWSYVYNGVSNLDDVATGLVIIGGDIFVAGYTTDATNGTDIILFQLDAGTGTVGWQNQINGMANGNDKPNGITISGEDVLVCGEVDNSTTGMDAFLVRVKGSNGSTVYKQDYDFGNTANRATALVRDSTGNVGVVGTALNGSVYEYHATFYDSTGVLYSVNRESTNLSVSNVDPRIACDTIAHHFYVCGEKMNLSKDIFVYQLTPSGNTSWRKSYDGHSNSDIDAAIGLAVNGEGVVYVAGLARSTSGQYDYASIRINQTPVYFPPDINSEPVNEHHLYIPNKGQLLKTDSTLANEVLYYTHNTTPEIYMEQNAFNAVYKSVDTSYSTLDAIEKIQHKFKNCNPLAELHEYLPTSTHYNYFLGHAASPDIADLQGHERLFAPNLYPGIDLHYFSHKEGLKYYFVLKPYAVNEIQIEINGAESKTINATTGNLVINGTLGSMELSRPVFYTVNMLGQPVPISGSASWVQNGNTYQIGLPSYTASMPVIIMVQAVQSAAAVGGFGSKGNMDYSTYYGSQDNDVFNDIKTSANGTRYITGWTDSQVFPLFNSQALFKGDRDVVILKYSPGDTLLFATMMGGSSRDEGNSIAINTAGEIFVGGWTASTNFTMTSLTGASNQTINGKSSTLGILEDGFLYKINATGNIRLWGRYYGGSRQDMIHSIFVDGQGNLYYAGEAFSTDIPMINAAQSQVSTWQTTQNCEAIFGKLNANMKIQWSTYFGETSSQLSVTKEVGKDITVDNSGNVMAVGWTDCNNLPVNNTTGNNNTFYNGSLKGLRDGFMVRYSPTGAKQFASYFGGTNLDEITRVFYNSFFDEYYFAGTSYDTTAFPFVFKAGAHNSKYKINKNAFIAKMDGGLTKKWSTFYGKGKGGSKEYEVTGLASDGYGVVYLSGHTTADTLTGSVLPPTTVVYKDSVLNARDGYVAIFNPDQSIYHTHYFGGTGDDRINNLDISQGQNLYIVGQTKSTDFPIAYNVQNASQIDSTFNGADDGFISRFQLINYQVTDLKRFDFDKATLSVYPNPANSKFILELEGQESTKPELRVFNLMGQLIHKQTLTENTSEINCESWANGVYLLVVNNNNTQTTFKIIKN